MTTYVISFSESFVLFKNKYIIMFEIKVSEVVLFAF